MQEQQNKRQGHLQQDQGLKKSILWNVVEPGDPYDIRKSMIARLPGDRKTFMGNKLELVCLLQAAEIERLSLNLAEYRVRLSEMEKNQLDRHSYEVQIKQLAACAQNEELMRAQNARLKNFIDRLHQQLQETKRQQSNGNTQLSSKYHQALTQIQLQNDQQGQLNTQNDNLRQLLSSKTNELLQAREEISNLVFQLKKYEDDSDRVEQYEQRFALLGEQIKRLNVVLKTKTEEISFITQKFKQSEQLIRNKKQQNQYLINSQIQLNQQISQLKAQLQNTKRQRQSKQNSHNQIKLKTSLLQIQRLTSLFTTVSKERDELTSQMKRFQNQNNQTLKLLNQKERAMSELESNNNKLQNSSGLIGREVERLNNVLKNKLDQINTLQMKCNRLSEDNQQCVGQIRMLENNGKEIVAIGKQREQLQQYLNNQKIANQKLSKLIKEIQNQKNVLIKETEKIPSYQERVSLMIQQIKRLNQIMLNIQNQNKQLHNKIYQNQRVQSDHKRIERQLNQLKNIMTQQDANKRTLNERIADLNKKSESYQILINQLSGEVNRLNQVLKFKLQEYNASVQKYNKLLSDYQELQHRHEGQSKNNQKIQSYENKLALLSLEIERLNQNVQLKTNENSQLLKINQNLSLEINDIRKRLSEVDYWRKQNQELKKQITDKLTKSNVSLQQFKNQIFKKQEEIEKMDRQYQIKIQEYLNEVQRLNYILKLKLEELRISQAKVAALEHEKHDLIAKIQQTKNKQKEVADLQRLNNLLRLKVQEAARWETSNHQLVKKHDYLQQNVVRLEQQNTSIRDHFEQLKSEREEHLSQLNDYKVKVQHILMEVDRLQQLLESFKSQNETQKIQIVNLKQQLSGNNIKEKNQKLLQEIERLKRIIQEQKEQIKQLRLVLSQDYSMEKRLKEQLSLIVILFAEIQTLRKRLQDTEKEVEDVRRESLAPLKA